MNIVDEVVEVNIFDWIVEYSEVFTPPVRSKPPKREKRVGIYCRVSTNDTEQFVLVFDGWRSSSSQD
jgi:hypothetical protein